MSVSVTNFGGDRSSYAVDQVRFTEQNRNQPVKVYLHPIRDVGAETTGHLRYAIGNGQAGTISVKFVVRTNMGLPAPPPPPTRESESEEQSVPNADEEQVFIRRTQLVEEPQANALQEMYAALLKTFYDGITANAQHGDDASGGWNKRFLKAMGYP